MGMTKISQLFDKLSKSNDLVAVTLCEEIQTLYISILKGHIGPGEIKTYIENHKFIENSPESHKEDISELLDLISMIGSVQ